MSTFQTLFEQFAPEYVAAAWDFADRSDRVETLWVYVSQDRGALYGDAYYRVGGELVMPYQLGHLIPEADSSPEGQDALYDRINEATRAFVAEIDDISEMPARMILRFTPETGSMDAEFLHGALQPGVADDDLEIDSRIADRWFERLVATGNDSAEL